MKKELIFLLIIILQINCTGKQNNRIDSENIVVDSVKKNEVGNETNANGKQITISEHNISFSYTEISKSEYERLKGYNKNEVLSIPKEKFEETDNGLSIKLSDKKTLSFVNNDGKECVSCIEIYRYVGYSAEQNIQVYSQRLYESTEFFLVNEQGVISHICGNPSFLNGGNLMICSVGMLGIEGAPNGFQIYTFENGTVKLVKQEDLEDWIPNDAFWISNNELIMAQDFLDDEGDGSNVPPSKYIKIKILK